ncbi:uncharacterized protein LOC121404874 [Drosophila obscura]|nr:uncharacterized protein LOC121404874 [Drosophila obscura]
MHLQSVHDQKIKKLKRRIFAPGAPKPPLKAYVRFTNERRKELKRDCLQTWLQLSKIHREKFIYDKWHQLSKECKVPYIEAAAKGQAIYKKKLRRFLRQNPNILEEELAKLKKKQTKRKAVSSSSSDLTDDDDPHDLVPLSKVIRLDDPHRANGSSAAVKNKEPVASTSKSLSTESVPLPLNTRRTSVRAQANIMDYESGDETDIRELY